MGGCKAGVSETTLSVGRARQGVPASRLCMGTCGQSKGRYQKQCAMWEGQDITFRSHALCGKGQTFEFWEAGHIWAYDHGQRESVINHAPRGQDKTGSSSMYAIYGCM